MDLLQYNVADMDVDVDMPVVASKKDDSTERFEVKKWNAVALWAWDIVVDNCAICRNHIMNLCLQLSLPPVTASEECNAAWGICNTRNGCPPDNREWELQKYVPVPLSLLTAWLPWELGAILIPSI
ncbi:hypothetical protein BJV78DRAFT_616403 [Lactifluus subvellereus]|nr:hypothetical protein BJV78DRAFT_616403 [Lactifluus subvellereus]